MIFKNNIFTILNSQELESFIIWAAKDAAVALLKEFSYEHKQEISKDLTVYAQIMDNPYLAFAFFESDTARAENFVQGLVDKVFSVHDEVDAVMIGSKKHPDFKFYILTRDGFLADNDQD